MLGAGVVGAALGALISWRFSYWLRAAYFGTLTGILLWLAGSVPVWLYGPQFPFDFSDIAAAFYGCILAGLVALLIPPISRFFEGDEPPTAFIALRFSLLTWFLYTAAFIGVGGFYLTLLRRCSLIRLEKEQLEQFVGNYGGTVWRESILLWGVHEGGPLRRTWRWRVMITNPRFDDDSLAELAEFSEIRALQLVDCSITDAGVKTLHRFPELEYVDLSGSKITSAGIIDLAKLPKLREVTLERTSGNVEGEFLPGNARVRLHRK
jgi:hypothetical protein